MTEKGKNNEIWKYVQTSSGRKQVSYYISNYGRLKTVTKHGKTKITLGANNGTNHLFCTIGFIHRLVATAFIPNPDNLPEVDHIDGNPANNKVENLHWVTHILNMHNPITLTRMRKYPIGYHEKLRVEKKAKHIVLQIKDDKVIAEFASQVEAAKAFGVGRNAINNAINSNRTSCGYHWKYKEDR